MLTASTACTWTLTKLITKKLQQRSIELKQSSKCTEHAHLDQTKGYLQQVEGASGGCEQYSSGPAGQQPGLAAMASTAAAAPWQRLAALPLLRQALAAASAG